MHLRLTADQQLAGTAATGGWRLLLLLLRCPVNLADHCRRFGSSGSVNGQC